uniref:Uncharacterized protein n=1 Tax=Rangifer tarandus platyrhynchus TaxID=3082113 RepID=A0ACB0EI55_RANTA|nr:unnamed protein product [Rangifer tarandus platyrhynchus]
MRGSAQMVPGSPCGVLRKQVLWECFLPPGAAGGQAGEVGLSSTTVRQPVQLSGSHGSGHGSTGRGWTGPHRPRARPPQSQDCSPGWGQAWRPWMALQRQTLSPVHTPLPQTRKLLLLVHPCSSDKRKTPSPRLAAAPSPALGRDVITHAAGMSAGPCKSSLSPGVESQRGPRVWSWGLTLTETRVGAQAQSSLNTEKVGVHSSPPQPAGDALARNSTAECPRRDQPQSQPSASESPRNMPERCPTAGPLQAVAWARVLPPWP